MSSASHSANALPSNFRPPVISLLYAGVWSLATHHLYLTGLHGLEWGTFASCVTGGMAIGQILKATKDRAMMKALCRKAKRFQATAREYGMACFATKKDLTKAEFLSDHQGIFLGTFSTGKRTSRDVFYDGEASLSVIAPAGESKEVSQ